jgi:cysteine desulfurase
MEILKQSAKRMSKSKQTFHKKTFRHTPVYLDCNATTPVEPLVIEIVQKYLAEEFGNEGSRTHEYGASARQAVQKSRDQVAAMVGAGREEVFFTSGATESNNLAILGLAAFGEETERKHILSTQIEHKAVLEPLEELASRGFEIELLAPNCHGNVSADQVKATLRPDTLLVSVMHANNETGVVQPIDEIAAVLEGHRAFFHVDAAQTFGKLINPLQNKRIDLISLSAHKIHGPKGIGALIARRRGFDRAPLKPLTFGGGQERGLRPGTLPVHLIAGLGLAAEMASKSYRQRAEANLKTRTRLLKAIGGLDPAIHGDEARMLPHVINFSIPGVNSEAAIVALKDLVAISNGSACTSASYSLSHVLKAMGLPDDEITSALRISWCHLTPEVDWNAVAARLASLR